MSSPPFHPTIALLQSSSLTSVVQQEVERAILAGEYPPGTKLTEANLADRMGVSRGPVREAFRMLEEAGLVRTEKNRGVFVRDIPLDEALEIYDLRAVMEELVGRLLADRITPAQLRELRGQVDAMERAVKSADVDSYHRLNLAFHDQLVEMAGNRKLAALYRKLIKELSLFRRRNLSDDGSLPQSVAEHRQILKAIASGESEAAGAALFAHTMASKQRTIAHEQRRRDEPASGATDASPIALKVRSPRVARQ